MTHSKNNKHSLSATLRNLTDTLIPFSPHLKEWMSDAKQLKNTEPQLIEGLLNKNFAGRTRASSSLPYNAVQISLLNQKLLYLWPDYQDWVIKKLAHLICSLAGCKSVDVNNRTPFSIMPLDSEVKTVLKNLDAQTIHDFYSKDGQAKWRKRNSFKRTQVVLFNLKKLANNLSKTEIQTLRNTA